MSRWKPDARGRLEQAASELFNDQGYERTTVADIAARAGLTERTFFRHFSDKREVLFSGSAMLRDLMVAAVDDAPPALPPIAAVQSAVEAAAIMMNPRRAHARERQRIVAAHPDVMERELIKRATLTAEIAAALHRRGVGEPAASLAADMGLAVFHIGFARWLDDPENRDYLVIVREAFDEIKSIVAGTVPA